MHKSTSESGPWCRVDGVEAMIQRTRRESLIYAQVISQLATHLHVPPNAATLVILGMLGLVVNHVFACIWYYLGADDFSEECFLATVPARSCT